MTQQLLQLYDWSLKLLLNKSNVDVVYLDFAEVFDKVGQEMIHHKLYGHDWSLKLLINYSDMDLVYCYFVEAFDKVGQDIIHHKLYDQDIIRNLGELLHDFLKNGSPVMEPLPRKHYHWYSRGTVLSSLLFIVAFSC